MLADLRYSARSLLRSPGLTLPLLLTVALGIGSNAAVFGFVRGFVTPDLAVPGIETVVALHARGTHDAFLPLTYDAYRVIEARTSSFETLGAVQETRRRLSAGDRTSMVAVAAVTPGIAAVLQLPAGDGAILSRRLWQDQFASREAVAGTQIRVDGLSIAVTGVAPAWLDGLYSGRVVDIWLPLRESDVEGSGRTTHTFSVLARLGAGVTAADAQAAVRAIGGEAGDVTLLPYTGMAPEAATAMSRISRLLPAVALVLFLIACANVAAFLLSRASSRAQETSVRVALGATRGRLARQLLSDSVLISIAGAAGGLLLAVWTADLVPALLFEQDALRLVFAPDMRAIALASAACAAVTMACGLLPLFELRHDDPAAVLRREAAGPTRRMRRLRSGLVATQMAFCCLLVVSTSLLFAGFRSILETTAATRLGEPIVATVDSPYGFGRPDLSLSHFRRAEEAVMSLDGVSEVAWAGILPGASASWYAVRVEPPRPAIREVELETAAFTPGSLDAIVLPPVAGRMFGGADTPQSCPVVVVNEEAAAVLYDGDATGRTIEDLAGTKLEIIGVVTTRQPDGATGPAHPTVYYYAAQTVTPIDGGPATFRASARDNAAAHGVLDANVVSPGYFDAMGFSSAAGARFAAAPSSKACRVGVINEEASELYFGGDAIGGAVIDGGGRRTEIVGVVRASLLRTSQRRIDPSIYFPMAQDVLPRMNLIVGTRDATAPLLEAIAQRLEPSAAKRAPRVVTLEQYLSLTALAPERIAALLVGAAAIIALGLGILGIYGGMADLVRQRRQEFALRVALGSGRGRVVGLVLAAGARLAGAGAAAGMLGAVFAGRWLGQVTPGVTSVTWWAWLAGPLVLASALLLACIIPARRAMLVDPLAIMRES